MYIYRYTFIYIDTYIYKHIDINTYRLVPKQCAIVLSQVCLHLAELLLGHAAQQRGQRGDVLLCVAERKAAHKRRASMSRPYFM